MNIPTAMKSAMSDPRWRQKNSAECPRCERIHSFVAPDGSQTCPPCWFTSLAASEVANHSASITKSTADLFANAAPSAQKNYLDAEEDGKTASGSAKPKKRKPTTHSWSEITPIDWTRYHDCIDGRRCEGRCGRFLSLGETRAPLTTPGGRSLCDDCWRWRAEKIRRASGAPNQEGLRTYAIARMRESVLARKIGYEVPLSMVRRYMERKKLCALRFADE